MQYRFFSCVIVLCQSLAWATLSIVSTGGASHAQTVNTSETGGSAGYTIDCTDVSINYEDDPTLTQSEKLALMEQSFYRSLSKFDACQDPMASSSPATSSSSALSGMSGSESSQEDGNSESSQEDGNISDAMASGVSDMSGTESPPAPGVIEPVSDIEQNLDNGKPPEDIPDADNDSVLEAQIRQAAIAETDPEQKKRLWNEYRKYKGLPQVD